MRIVGIGASAGGLVALEQFFEQVPARSGLSFVVVQHLAPTQKAVLAELLQRVTVLPVCEVVATTPIEPDKVYVIPPNAELSVSKSHLRLGTPGEPRGMRLPIDVLFSSIALDQGERAIGVVLSGMGADGTLGLQAIKVAGGLTVVQEPTSAQFDSMPRSAIAADCADIVATPEEMPARILAYTKHTAQQEAVLPDVGVMPASDAMTSIFNLLQKRTRHDFSHYKPSTLNRRIERRMAIHGLLNITDYVSFLQGNPQEVDLLFKELLIGVTAFFRDPAMWQYMKEVVIPAMLDKRGEKTAFRAWVAGCSTGEEAYTLAMVFTEVVASRPEHQGCTLQIFASDLSPDAINAARTGAFRGSNRADLSAQRMARFFTVRDDALHINKTIRDMVLFAHHNVVLDPPFTKLDLLCCRNLLIYFETTLQRRLLPLFHYSLRPDGVLVLGSSETVGPFNRLFEPLESALRIYRRLNDVVGGGSDLLLMSFPPLSKLTKEFAVSNASSLSPSADSLQTAADRVLLQVHAPPAVVVNHGGDIVYISGRTGKYLEPAAGKANWNFYAMVRDGLREPVANAITHAMAAKETVQLHGVLLTALTGAQNQVDVTVQPINDAGALQGMVMIVFRDVTPSARKGRRKAASAIESEHAAELARYQDQIVALRDQARTSKEELQSAIEELQSTNEELQSANEELTTSKEEMQSMNEELQTVNVEMQTKLDDLELAQSDMKNLLNSTDIAMLFLDQKLNVRRYTERATKIINLRESDIGRPLSDLTTSLDYPTLNEDTQETLRTLVFSEKQIPTHDGRWYSVRIMPYRRLDNMIDGAVITFVDITSTKELETRLRQS